MRCASPQIFGKSIEKEAKPIFKYRATGLVMLCPGVGDAFTVSVLRREEGYMVKYGLSTRDFPLAQTKGNPEGSGLILPYIPT